MTFLKNFVSIVLNIIKHKVHKGLHKGHKETVIRMIPLRTTYAHNKTVATDTRMTVSFSNTGYFALLIYNLSNYNDNLQFPNYLRIPRL